MPTNEILRELRDIGLYNVYLKFNCEHVSDTWKYVELGSLFLLTPQFL